MDKRYNFQQTDSKIYDFWMKDCAFEQPYDESQPNFCCILPPPNANGNAHIGHALNSTIQDILVRYHRLKGYNSICIPGIDHGGISASSTFDKELANKNIDKRNYTREEYFNMLYSWSQEKKVNITNQIKELGCAFSWNKEQFTLNNHFSNIVNNTFKKLYSDGLIYKNKYIVNYCLKCETVLSDDEVNNDESNGTLYYIKYKIDNNNYITVATSRPETIFGDTAVAFNPSDSRYTSLENQYATIPIINKRIKIIADNFVKKEFASGLVKITPAHNKNDYMVGVKHNLDMPVIMDKHGNICNTNTEYDGMYKLKCRKQLVKKLTELDLIEQVKSYKHIAQSCYRCNTEVESVVSDQWFIKMQPLIEKVRENKETEIIPDYQNKILNNWLDNSVDWCISRQLKFGHRIPIWYCKDCSNIMCDVSVNNCSCGSNNVYQEEDVLDTWFSSGLWGHGVFDNDDFEHFYPSSVLVTGKDILYFWVARMMMLSIYMTGKAPFKKVLLHGIVRDSSGQKMSKSKNNGINPSDVIKQYGADTLRYSLVFNIALGCDLNIGISNFKTGNNLCTKLWNSVRYVLAELDQDNKFTTSISKCTYFDAYYLEKFNTMLVEYETGMDQYNFGAILKSLSDYFCNYFCNIHLEIAKCYISNYETQQLLVVIISKVLRLYHPFIPFITEELWGRLRPFLVNVPESIMDQLFPEKFQIDFSNGANVESFMAMIDNVRTQKGINKYSSVDIGIVDNVHFDFVKKHLKIVSKLTKIENVSIHNYDDTIQFQQL